MNEKNDGSYVRKFHIFPEFSLFGYILFNGFWGR